MAIQAVRYFWKKADWPTLLLPLAEGSSSQPGQSCPVDFVCGASLNFETVDEVVNGFLDGRVSNKSRKSVFFVARSTVTFCGQADSQHKVKQTGPLVETNPNWLQTGSRKVQKV